MKTDRFSKAIPKAVLWAVLLFSAGLPAAGQIRIQLPGFSFESDSRKLAKALAQQAGEVKRRFDTNRRALRTVPDPGGVPAYPRQEVAGLIAGTEKDLDQAIEQAGKQDLEPLRAWSAEELRKIREELVAPSGQTAALPAAARVASLGGFSGISRGSAAAASQPATIPAGTANRLLDQVGEVVGRIFFLAESNDLEVKLWFGSTPASRAVLSFWPQGRIKGSAPRQTTLRTHDKKSVLRGLYDYSAAWKQGAVTQLVQYPSPAGAPAERKPGERLDLVNGTRFFCCRFDDQHCHHVDDEKECRP